MNQDVKKWWRSIIMALSSFGLLSSVGYYLINLENTTLGQPAVVPQKEQVDLGRQEAPGDMVMGVVTKVVDGDTIKVRGSAGETITVRMLGIDTPETSHSPRAEVRGVADCFADEATMALSAMVQGKQVALESDAKKPKHDKYGRLLAYVFINDGESNPRVNVNQAMIQQGYAYEYTYRGEKYQYQKEFKQAQKEAEQNRRGLWASGACQ